MNLASRGSGACRETVADAVHDKERANFCDYFQPRPQAFTAQDPQPAQDARNVLDALFGDDRDAASGANDADTAHQQLDELFGPDKD